MDIKYLSQFKLNFKKRIQPDPFLFNRFKERVKMFKEDPSDPILGDHALKEDKVGLKAFAITPDIRVIYYSKGHIAFFLDIGTHDQVY